jgi:hypothetical protein
MTNTDQNWKDYARGLCYCEGGNPNAELWICGIEPAGVMTVAQFNSLWQNMVKYVWTDSNGRTFTCWNDNVVRDLISQFDLHSKIVAKILMSVYEEGDPDNEVEVDNYCRTRLYRQDGMCYRLNLYPLNNPREEDGWNEEKRIVTGFESDEEYRVWCKQNVFPRISERLNEYRASVKILLAAGRNNKDTFAAIFQANGTHIDDIRLNPNSIRGKYVDIWKPEQGMNLVVCPAISGRYGTGLNNDIVARNNIAEIIRKLLRNEFVQQDMFLEG